MGKKKNIEEQPKWEKDFQGFLDQRGIVRNYVSDVRNLMKIDEYKILRALERYDTLSDKDYFDIKNQVNRIRPSQESRSLRDKYSALNMFFNFVASQRHWYTECRVSLGESYPREKKQIQNNNLEPLRQNKFEPTRWTHDKLIKNFKLRLLTQDRVSSGYRGVNGKKTYFPIRLIARLFKHSNNKKLQDFIEDWAAHESNNVIVLISPNANNISIQQINSLTINESGVLANENIKLYSYYSINETTCDIIPGNTPLKYLHIDHEPVLVKIINSGNWPGLENLTRMIDKLAQDHNIGIIKNPSSLKKAYDIIFNDANILHDFMDENLLDTIKIDLCNLSIESNLKLQLVTASYNLQKKRSQTNK